MRTPKPPKAATTTNATFSMRITSAMATLEVPMEPLPRTRPPQLQPQSLAAGAFACHGINSHDGTYGRKRNRSAHGIRQEDIARKREREHKPRRLTTKNQRRSRKGNRQIRINIRDVINPARPIGTGINVHNRRSGDHHLGAAKREGDKGDDNVDFPNLAALQILGAAPFPGTPPKIPPDAMLSSQNRRSLPRRKHRVANGKGPVHDRRSDPNASLGAIVGPASSANLGATFRTTLNDLRRSSHHPFSARFSSAIVGAASNTSPHSIF